jgi:hypothetical protein
MELVNGGGGNSPEKIYAELQSVGTSIPPVSNDQPCIGDSSSGNDLDLNCEYMYCPQNTEMVEALTAGMCISESDNRSSSPSVRDNSYVCNSNYASWDDALQNLPKDLYVDKLLELTANNEQSVIEYRCALHAKAKNIQGCPPGKLITRKTTKSSPSTTKYARDCFALYMYCSGDSSLLSDVFDKSKQESNLYLRIIHLSNCDHYHNPYWRG